MSHLTSDASTRPRQTLAQLSVSLSLSRYLRRHGVGVARVGLGRREALARDLPDARHGAPEPVHLRRVADEALPRVGLPEDALQLAVPEVAEDAGAAEGVRARVAAHQLPAVPAPPAVGVWGEGDGMRRANRMCSSFLGLIRLRTGSRSPGRPLYVCVYVRVFECVLTRIEMECQHHVATTTTAAAEAHAHAPITKVPCWYTARQSRQMGISSRGWHRRLLNGKENDKGRTDHQLP